MRRRSSVPPHGAAPHTTATAVRSRRRAMPLSAAGETILRAGARAICGLEARPTTAMTTNTSSQLHLLADVSRSLATFTDLDELVQFATQRTRELFEAEGCALLLLDAARREFRFPVASQRQAGASAAALAEIRFPADRGIAGWVLSHDEAALVPDTATDPRFYDAVDRQTAMRTRALLCAPLRTRRGNIGVLEVVNPGAAHLEAADL